VSIRIYDIAGRELADLGTGPMSAGQHSTMWNLSDRSGNRVAKGIYFARMTFGNQIRTQHIVVSN
jgi:flagellar hook assembly protein FlgD